MPVPLTRLWLGIHHLARMTDDAKTHFPNETGGVLMGYWVSSDEVVVSEIILGGPKAQRTSTRFIPDSKFQQTKIDELYYGSGGQHSYLGDWHTHPCGKLTLSSTDRATLHLISKTPEARARAALMLIIAGETTWTARAWKWNPSKVFWRRTSVCEILSY